MPIEKNTFNTLVTQIDSVHKTLQEKSIKSVSIALTIRNWLIGYYIVEYEQNGEDRAEYGAKIIENLVQRLKHIKGMSATNLRLFRVFYTNYPQISQTVTDQFKLENLKIQQTVSVKSLEVVNRQFFVSKYKINLPSVEEIESFISHEMEEF